MIHEGVANGRSCQYEDAIYPFCWLIYDDMTTKRVLESKLNQVFQSSSPVSFSNNQDYQAFLKEKVNGILGCVIIAMISMY